MPDCQRKTIFGRPACRFEGRYDEIVGPLLDKQLWGPTLSAAQIRAYRDTTTYARDVCIKCGKTIERSKS